MNLSKDFVGNLKADIIIPTASKFLDGLRKLVDIKTEFNGDFSDLVLDTNKYLLREIIAMYREHLNK